MYYNIKSSTDSIASAEMRVMNMPEGISTGRNTARTLQLIYVNLTALPQLQA